MSDIYIGIDPGSKNCAMVSWSPQAGLVTAWKPKPPMPTGVLRLRKLMVDIANEFTKIAAHQPGGAIKLTILSLFDSDDRRGFPVLVAPQQLKKFVSGKGNGRKDMMPKEIYKRWEMDFNDPNIAEAYALARVAHAVDARPEGLTQFQLDVIAALDGRTEWIPIAQRRLVRVGR